ncbi:perlucin-like protein [Dreissena polymorpha]|uniref:C-type lectin domain-containing protein n=1 Tax=Dreissena polymorpha TaxID=45954 RepID=A0A9D3Y834_DREPO|nr:perlucin-like protein [Dreissena polymorpha]KAH3693514.1 hypothetical protein DPMN_080947 [Dreissena polymorpha]
MLLFVLFACLICCNKGVTCTNCPNGWIAHEISCYLFGHEDNLLDFTTAEQFCRQRGGHLIHVDDAQENAFIKDQLNERKPIHWWLGITDEYAEGVWRWFDDDTVAEYTDFESNDHSHPGEDCGLFASIYEFRWADIECTAHYPPLCELSARNTEVETVG